MNDYYKGNKILFWFYRFLYFFGGYRIIGICIILVNFDKFKSRVMNKVVVILLVFFRRGNFVIWLSDIENEKKSERR